jgi:hypothetical protein
MAKVMQSGSVAEEIVCRSDHKMVTSPYSSRGDDVLSLYRTPCCIFNMIKYSLLYIFIPEAWQELLFEQNAPPCPP